MARRKKRKDREATGATAQTPPIADESSKAATADIPETGAVGADRGAEQNTGATEREKAHEKKKSGVSVATAIAGMFLTLVLGLYTGSLLPGVFMGEKTNLKLNQASPQTSQMQSADAESNLDSRLRQSMADLEKRAAANPSSAPDWINLGNIYFDAHQPQKAISAYERALTLAPDNPDVLTDLGIMYREIGRYEKAVECFRKAVAIDPGHQNALFNAGVVLSSDMKLKAEAAAMWEQLLSVNPQAQAPNGVPLMEMVKELRQTPAGSANKL